MKKITHLIFSIVVFIITFATLYLIFLPAITIHSISFILMIIVSLLVAVIPVVIGSYEHKGSISDVSSNIICTLILIFLGILLIGLLSGSRIFNASKYSNLLTVTESTFTEEIIEDTSITNIAIMDTPSARILGKRAVGSITELVSQYEVSDDYTQIALNDSPMKVAPINYGGLIKYFNNKSNGIPGYVKVDPVSNTAEYVELDSPMKYSPSAYFSYDLLRHIRTEYKTEMFYDYYFEISDEGLPYWICPVKKINCGLFGGITIKGVVIVNACSGEMEYYSIEDIPSWVDRVYDGDILTELYDDYGTLQSGFWNSVIGNKGCKKTTDDYGYKIIDGDVYIYTGVTSVANDESNIGFVLINQRTMEATYFPVSGAEEYSAMSAAEGEVQDLGYDAAFPSLINISGVPTYILALKDSGGLTKQYALVNVEQYNIVAIGQTQSEAIKNYKTALSLNNISSSEVNDEVIEKDITVKSIDYIIIDGNTYAYIKSEDGMCFKESFSENESLILISVGDNIKVSYYDTQSDILSLQSFEILN